MDIPSRKPGARPFPALTNVTEVTLEDLQTIAPHLLKKESRNLIWAPLVESMMVDEVVTLNGNEVKKERIVAPASTETMQEFCRILQIGYLTNPVIEQIREHNKLVRQESEKLKTRSGGTSTLITEWEERQLYQRILTPYSIISRSAFEAVVPNTVKPEELMLKLEDFVSKEQQLEINEQNPDNITLCNITFPVTYHQEYGRYYASVMLTKQQALHLKKEECEHPIPSGREVNFTLTESGFHSVTAESIADLQRIINEQQHEREENERQSQHMKERQRLIDEGDQLIMQANEQVEALQRKAHNNQVLTQRISNVAYDLPYSMRYFSEPTEGIKRARQILQKLEELDREISKWEGRETDEGLFGKLLEEARTGGTARTSFVKIKEPEEPKDQQPKPKKEKERKIVIKEKQDTPEVNPYETWDEEALLDKSMTVDSAITDIETAHPNIAKISLELLQEATKAARNAYDELHKNDKAKAAAKQKGKLHKHMEVIESLKEAWDQAKKAETMKPKLEEWLQKKQQIEEAMAKK